MKTKGYYYSVVGSREMNQDAYLSNDERSLYAVADGVGGGLKGEVASKMAVEGMDRYFSEGASLTEIIKKLQADILKESMDSFGEALMGTTFTVCHLTDSGLRVGHVGDSRLYVFSDGLLKQITEDQEFYDENLQTTVLASYLGVPPEVQTIRIVEEKIDVKPGDKLLLCSDGLYRQQNEAQLAATIRAKSATPDELVKTLCHQAAEQAYSDNVTVVYVEISA